MNFFARAKKCLTKASSPFCYPTSFLILKIVLQIPGERERDVGKKAMRKENYMNYIVQVGDFMEHWIGMFGRNQPNPKVKRKA